MMKNCVVVTLATLVPIVGAFQTTIPNTRYESFQKHGAFNNHRTTSTLIQAQDTSEVEQFIVDRYPGFSSIISENDAVWKALRDSYGYTIFIPNSNAFGKLGEKKVSQLLDPRNLETKEKIGSYHVIAEPVTASQIFNSGGIITLGGEVPVGRSVTGGFMGIGGKEDGGVTVNGANVVESYEFNDNPDCIIHEVDDLISPSLLWRYVDQLRIPGSQ